MSSAPFVWRRDGRPDWGAMWTTFCDLALHGGPPQRGADTALHGADASSSPAMLAELQRGIHETTGLAVEAAEPGWIAIGCESRRMAAWLCAAIIVENVDARVEGDRLLVPAGSDFVLEDQVRSVITVVAKTHHYWREHLHRSPRS
jgi:sirohydrochlorin cobaltochelatase